MAKAKKAATKKASKNTSKGSAMERLPLDSMAKRAKECAASKEASETVTVDRRERSDRRKGEDRRKADIPVAVERRKLERRAKVSRRRQIDPTTCERDYSLEEIEFMNAMDQYKRTSGRMFPTCSEILEVLRKLGYEKRSVLDASPAPALSESPAPVAAELVDQAALPAS